MNAFAIEKNTPFRRFERALGGSVDFIEIHVSDKPRPASPRIWICEGVAGQPGSNRVLEESRIEVALKKATALLAKQQAAGFVCVGEVNKIIDGRYAAALANHDPADLRRCLAEGYSPHAFVTENGHWSAPIWIALRAGAAACVGVLIDAGCDVEHVQNTRFKEAPELRWLERGTQSSLLSVLLEQKLDESVKCDVAKVLLARGANPDSMSHVWGYSLLHRVDSVSIATLLVDHGARIDSRSDSRRTPLLSQCLANRVEIVDLLIRRGADVNCRDSQGDTPLILAAREQGVEKIQLLLEKGADPSVQNKEKNNALLQLLESRQTGPEKTEAKGVKCVKMLLAAGIPASSKGRRGVTALMAAVQSGASQAAKVLVAAGADIDATDTDGQTALMQGAAKRDGALVKRCLLLGAALDLQDRQGKTALMHACGRITKGRNTALLALLAARASLHVTDKSRRSALHYATAEEAIMLLDAGAMPDEGEGAALFATAVAADSVPLALALIEKATVHLAGLSGSARNADHNRSLEPFLRKLISAKPDALASLTSADAGIQAVLASLGAHAGTRATRDEASEGDLPDVLRLDYWASRQSSQIALPAFWVAGVHPAPRLKANGRFLPPHAVDTIARMLLVSSHDKPVAEIERVTAACDAESLSAFAWSIFTEWNAKGDKASDGLFQALAFWGNDACARGLIPLIRDWPRVSHSPRAALGLEILGTLGTDGALRAIQAIAAKTRYPATRARAQALMDRIAATCHLTPEQFEDRLVPSLELSDEGTLALSFGARVFQCSVDEQLNAVLKDASGAALKALPKPAEGDDASLAEQARQAWSEFKLALKPVASLQLDRLEKAMLGGRRWLGDEFRRLIAGHPLLRNAVRGLVWGVHEGDRMQCTFALDGGGGFIGSDGAAFALPGEASVGLPHPLFLGADLNAWTARLAARNQRQPFAQLVRKTFRVADDADATHFGVNGLVVPSNALKGLKQSGWGVSDTFAGTFDSFTRRVGDQWVSLTVSPGLSMQQYDLLAKEQTLRLDLPRPDELSPVEYSELIRDLLALRP